MKTYFPLPTLQTHKTIGQNGLRVRATLNKYILKILFSVFSRFLLSHKWSFHKV